MADKKRLKAFVNAADFEVHTSGVKLMGVGLKWGESKRLQSLGFKRKEQIKLLDTLQDNPKKAKKLIGY